MTGDHRRRGHQRAFTPAADILLTPHISPLSSRLLGRVSTLKSPREIRDGLQAIRGHGIITYIVNLCQGSLGEPG